MPPPKSSAALTKSRPLFQSLRTWKVGIALMPQAAATACSARGQVGSLPIVRQRSLTRRAACACQPNVRCAAQRVGGLLRPRLPGSAHPPPPRPRPP